MAIHNKDFFFLSGKDLTQETEKTYLNCSKQNVVLKSEAPELAAIYGEEPGSIEMIEEASSSVVSSDSSYPFAYKFGNFFVKRNSNSGFLASLTPDFAVSQNFGANYNSTLAIFEDYHIQVKSGALTSLQVNRFDKDTTDLTTFINSFTEEYYDATYFSNIFNTTNNNYIWEISRNNSEYIVLIGRNTDVNTIMRYCKIEDFKNDYTDLNIWSEVDLTTLFTSTHILGSSDLTYLFLCNNSNTLIISHRYENIIYLIDIETLSINSLDVTSLGGTNVGLRLSFNTSPSNGKDYISMTNNTTPYTYKNIYEISNNNFNFITDAIQSSDLYDSFYPCFVFEENFYLVKYGDLRGYITLYVKDGITYEIGLFLRQAISSDYVSRYSKIAQYITLDNIAVFIEYFTAFHFYSLADTVNNFVIDEIPKPNSQVDWYVEKK